MSEQNTWCGHESARRPWWMLTKRVILKHVDVAAVLRYVGEVHPQEDFVHADTRNLGEKCERRHTWFCGARRSLPGAPLMRHVHHEELLPELEHFVDGVKYSQPASFLNMFELDSALEVKKVRVTDERHETTEGGRVGFSLVQDLLVG